MDLKSTINAYQKLLLRYRFDEPLDFSEEFAQQRYRKKMEKPSRERKDELQQKCWNDFLLFDNHLPAVIHHPSSEWYKARLLLHEWMRGLRPGSIDFPKGSSFEPTYGSNSIESRLSRGKWTTTRENFENFARVVYNHKALKRAFRRRYSRWYQRQNFDLPQRASDSYMWNRLRIPEKEKKWAIFLWKMERIVTFVYGSRFSTVPKNNEKRRPINIEPFGNILTQRSYGNSLRNVLKHKLSIDLDNLADVHRVKIQDSSLATIDLSNASDSNSLALIKFLLPKRQFTKINQLRSPMLLGLDGNYHPLQKVSSMGNGFTFELMTLVLTAISRTLDSEATVFGDDIIIKKECAPRLIELLKEVGWVVNEGKSFIDGPFRESCGANWHDDFGYVESFDFFYPETIADCALISNKAYALRKYPSFAKLSDVLRRLTPKPLRGGPYIGLPGETSGVKDRLEQIDFPIYFAFGEIGKEDRSKRSKEARKSYQIDKVYSFTGFRYVPKLKTPTVYDLNSRFHWGKYEMYLFSGRVSDDIVTGVGSWVSKKYYTDGHRVLTL